MKNILIIGAGISSATVANILANNGWKVTIFEKQDHIGGNCFDSFDKNGILIHNYGPHIFHTSHEDVYKFITKFTKLNKYINKVLVNVDDKLFPLPINFDSIRIIMKEKSNLVIDKLKSLFPNQKTVTLFDLRKIQDSLIKEFVEYISKNVYYNYSSKMWGKKFEEIDPATISRVKIVLGYEHNYFPEDKYQGLPIDGYTEMIKKMLNHPNITIYLKTNALDLLKFEENQIMFNGNVLKDPLIYCGPLDEALNYKYGMLPYRSLNIKFETLNVTKFQDTAVVNYPSHPTMTRIAEYKQMTLQKKNNLTTISKEYPGQFDLSSGEFGVRYYPIINPDTNQIHQKYLLFFKKYSNFYPLGRLSQYKYYDMDDAIKVAIELANSLTNKYN